jgi:endonuclease/exonuclease/phosphatase (EEP) superfamily protein YafD
MIIMRMSIWVVILTASLVYLLCQFSSQFWLAELAVHWRLHAAVAAVFFVIVFACMQHWAAAGYMLLLGIAFFWPAWQALQPAPVSIGAVKDRAVLLQFNINYGNNDFAIKAVPWIIAQNADIVILQEVDSMRARDLSALEAYYPWSQVKPNPNRNAFGMAIFTRFPVQEFRYVPTGERWNHYSFTALSLPSGAALHLYEIHLLPPVTSSFAQQRKNEMELMGKLLNEDKAPYRLLVGDLNSTLYSPHFAWLSTQSGMHHAQRGYKLEGTWPTLFPTPLRIGIDHTLASSFIAVEERTIGPYLGSDHLPVVTRLALYESNPLPQAGEGN